MKLGLIPGLVVLSGVLCVMSGAAHAQGVGETGPAAEMDALTPDDAVSVTAHLQMSNGQIERFNRLYDSHSSRRAKQEDELGRWEAELQAAQSPASFNEKQASRLLRDIGKAQQNIATDWLSTRAKALTILTSVQRAQLKALANDTRLRWREDSYSWLLLSDSTEHAAFESEAAPTLRSERATARPQRQRRSRNTGQGSYGVYGGYGYGQPQFGVYGNYGQGPVGVYGGIGRGGPSIGVGIGGVFSGRIFGR